MFVKADPYSPLVRTRNMTTLLGRQQLLQHKILYVRGLRSVVVMALFVGCGEEDKGNGHFSPSMYTVCLLSAAECCLLFLHRAQALSLSPSLADLAAASHSSPAQCCCLDFLISKQNHWVCPNKITLVVFAPTRSLHASLSRLPQLNPPLLVVLSYLEFQHIYQSILQSFLLALHLFCTSKCNLCAVVSSLCYHPQLHISLSPLCHQLRGYEDE